MKLYKKMVFVIVFLGALVISLFTGCGQKTEEPEKIRDLDFTVVRESELPEQLKRLVEEKKCNPFKLTYTGEDGLYIVQGYGAQPTGGYSVTVKELWLADNAICFCSELLGPKGGENVAQSMSYPFVAIKTEAIDLPVVFK